MRIAEPGRHIQQLQGTEVGRRSNCKQSLFGLKTGEAEYQSENMSDFQKLRTITGQRPTRKCEKKKKKYTHKEINVPNNLKLKQIFSLGPPMRFCPGDTLVIACEDSEKPGQPIPDSDVQSSETLCLCFLKSLCCFHLS